MQATVVQTRSGSAQGPVQRKPIQVQHRTLQLRQVQVKLRHSVQKIPSAAQVSVVQVSTRAAQATVVHTLQGAVQTPVLWCRHLQEQYWPLQCRHVHPQLRSLWCRHLNRSSTCRLLLSRYVLQVQLRPLHCGVDNSRSRTGTVQTRQSAAQASVPVVQISQESAQASVSRQVQVQLRPLWHRHVQVLQLPLQCRHAQVQLGPLCVDTYMYSSSLSLVQAPPRAAPSPVFHTSPGAAQTPGATQARIKWNKCFRQ